MPLSQTDLKRVYLRSRYVQDASIPERHSCLIPSRFPKTQHDCSGFQEARHQVRHQDG